MFEVIADFLRNMGIGIMWVSAGLGILGVTYGIFSAFRLVSEKIFSK